MIDQTNSITEDTTITVYLEDGNPNGVITAQISNWTGKVLIAPRSQLEKLAKRKELERTGVYILVGDDPERSLKDRVYIGQTDKILTRLAQHNSDKKKEFWDRTIIIVSKDDNLNTAHVHYLESRIIQLTIQAERASIQNQTSPETPNLPETELPYPKGFLKRLQILLPVLGFDFMVPVPRPTPQKDAQGKLGSVSSPIFQYKGKDFDAEAGEVEGVFVVLAGSKFRSSTFPSMPKGYAELRGQLIQNEKFIEQNGFLVLNTNFEFSSPSAAAVIVSGTRVNGRNAWKTKDTDETYNNWKQEQLKRAGIVTKLGN